MKTLATLLTDAIHYDRHHGDNRIPEEVVNEILPDATRDLLEIFGIKELKKELKNANN